MKKVLVIIVSYNFEPWIDRCLGSLRISSLQADVLVVDNASTDNSVARLKDDYPEVRLIESHENLGFGRANNIGMNIAITEEYETVFLLNQDAWVEAETLSSLYTLAMQHPEYGIVSPVHLTGDGKKLDPGFAVYSGCKTVAELPQDDSPVPIRFCNAALWMIPTKVIREVGGFCPLFYHYGEDVDFVNRLRYHGYAVAYLSTTFGCHDREYRPMTFDRWQRNEVVYLLSEYSNINYTPLRSFALGVLASIKKLFTHLLRGELRYANAMLGIAYHLLLRSGEVMHYRKENQQKHPLKDLSAEI